MEEDSDAGHSEFFYLWIGLEDLETLDLDGMYKKLCSNTRCIGLPVLRIKISGNGGIIIAGLAIVTMPYTAT